MPKPTHRGRYPFKIYAQLVLFVALAAVMNTLFGDLLQDVVGNYNLAYDAVVTSGLVGYAILFAFIIWRMDRSGSIGRLMGAKDAAP